MSDLFQSDESATPLDEDEKEGLIPSWVTYQHELNAIEQEGILEAEIWAFGRKHPNILTEKFLKELHKKMFGKVWRWAGQYRKTTKSIGIEAWQIQTQLRLLLDDTKHWIENNTYPPDEIAARFHHRLVWIHPFPNGNGRLARLATDILIAHLGGERFTWGQKNLVKQGIARETYIKALKEADKSNILPLLSFMRS